MKSASFHLVVGTVLLASFIASLSGSAQAATVAGTVKISCGYAGSLNKLLEITHGPTSVTGRDLYVTSGIDGSPIRSTLKVLKVVPGADVYEYDIHMVEHYRIGLLNENPKSDSSVPGSKDSTIELRVDLRHPENSEAHVRSRETMRDFSWEPGFLATHFNSDTTGRIACEIQI